MSTTRAPNFESLAARSPRTHAARRRSHDLPAPPPGLPRVLNGLPAAGALSLEAHLAVHGPLPHIQGGSRRRTRARALELLDEVERAGLLGRGGAAFPAAAKLRAVAGTRGRPVVVVNAVEAEPASRKDRTLLAAAPHIVLDGATLAAEALGADEAIVAVSELAAGAIESVETAIAERTREGAGGQPPRLRLALTPSQYVAGQESALINFLGGGPALPTFAPPLPFERGLYKRPTLVNNAETLAHLALIARHGAPWFRKLGTARQPGSALVTLTGPVASPGVYEVELGSSLGALLELAGGAGEQLAGALVGGYAGGWVPAEQLAGLTLADEALAQHGATFGAGVLALLPARCCPVSETARLARWLAQQSARQCGPCLHGLDALADTLEWIAQGSAGKGAGARLQQLATLTTGRGACRHPDGAVRMISSAVHTFGEDFAEHLRAGPCTRCDAAPQLPMPPRPRAPGRARAERMVRT